MIISRSKKHYLNADQYGFSLAELLIVLAIVGLFSTFLILSFAQLRGPRNLRIAQSELITNIRKVQAQTLSSRDINPAHSVRYYILNVNLATRTSYTISAIGVNKTSDQQVNFTAPPLQTIVLPPGVTIRSIAVSRPNNIAVPAPGCAQIGFGAPFAKTFIDYRQSGGTNCDFTVIAGDPLALNNAANHSVTIELEETNTARRRSVIVRGVTGLIQAQ